MKKSKWFFWSFLPFVNFAAWIHAGIRTGRNSYYWHAAVYSLPFTVAVVMGAVQENLGLSKQTVDHVNDWGSTAAVLLWIVGIIHVLLKKDSVDRQIQTYDEARMQTGRDVSNSTSQLPDKILVVGSDTSQPRTQEVAPSTPACQPSATPEAASILHHQESVRCDQQISTNASMKGTILDYSIQKSEGIISGDDNNRYRFAGCEWKASGAPTRGQRVAFGVADGRAIKVL